MNCGKCSMNRVIFGAFYRLNRRPASAVAVRSGRFSRIHGMSQMGLMNELARDSLTCCGFFPSMHPRIANPRHRGFSRGEHGVQLRDTPPNREEAEPIQARPLPSISYFPTFYLLLSTFYQNDLPPLRGFMERPAKLAIILIPLRGLSD